MGSVLSFEGEYDLACQERLRCELTEVCGEATVILDLARVTYWDSTCLSEVIVFARSRMRRGLEPATIVLKPATGVRRLFELTNVDRLFRIVESLDAAVAA